MNFTPIQGKKSLSGASVPSQRDLNSAWLIATFEAKGRKSTRLEPGLPCRWAEGLPVDGPSSPCVDQGKEE